MAETMQAFVMRKIGEIGVIEKPIPQPKATEAVIKTTAALVCTSDIHTLAGGIGERHELTLGHEGVGRIHALGSEVKGFREGERVAVNAITPCFHCENCLRGYTSQCTEMIGGWKFANMRDGVFADYFVVNDAEANLAPIPEDLSDEQAAYCCDMLSTGFMGAEHANIPLGGAVAVFAQGPVGLMATVGARLLGAGMVIAVESIAKRQELALRYGADEIVDFQKRDPVEAIMELTGGKGVDAAIEALGAQAAFEACVRVTRPGGTISNIGYHGEGETVNIPRMAWGVGMSDKKITTGLCPGGRERMERLMRLIRNGRVDPTLMTTHRFSFGEIEKAFELMKTKAEGVIKPLILFE
ncbi:MAG: NAD(P)-dependent alcohol dehydrogenase [Desulfuromonadales bacterium]|jgi:threonine dehydrogenase-like Zn-dependent dehydrogenase